MFYTLLTKIQANGGRRKRDTDYDPFQYLWSFFESDGRLIFDSMNKKISLSNQIVTIIGFNSYQNNQTHKASSLYGVSGLLFSPILKCLVN